MLNKFVLFGLILIPLTFMISSCNICDPEDDNNATPRDLSLTEKIIVSADNNFGLKLFKSLNSSKPENNLFISPLSISLAFGMALNGASGDTYDAMKTALELNGLTEKDINESYKNLIELLTNLDEEVIFNIANSIWCREGYSVEQAFLDINKEYFDAEVQSLDFSDSASKDIINNWVDDKTNGLIDKILEEDITADVVMYLINAIYFKGLWSSEFDKDKTNDGSFKNFSGTVSTIPLMFQNEEFDYFENGQYQAVDQCMAIHFIL